MKRSKILAIILAIILLLTNMTIFSVAQDEHEFYNHESETFCDHEFDEHAHDICCDHEFFLGEYPKSIEYDGETYILIEINGEKYYINEKDLELFDEVNDIDEPETLKGGPACLEWPYFHYFPDTCGYVKCISEGCYVTGYNYCNSYNIITETIGSSSVCFNRIFTCSKCDKYQTTSSFSHIWVAEIIKYATSNLCSRVQLRCTYCGYIDILYYNSHSWDNVTVIVGTASVCRTVQTKCGYCGYTSAPTSLPHNIFASVCTYCGYSPTG